MPMESDRREVDPATKSEFDGCRRAGAPEDRRVRSQAELAWDLAIEMAPRLKRLERSRLFAQIGADETYSAIEELLTRASRNEYQLTAPLVADLGRWVEGYVGTVREPRLRVIVRQLEIIAAGTPESRGGEVNTAD